MTNPTVDRVPPSPAHRVAAFSNTPWNAVPAGEDAWDGPVDLWVDDEDGDWDDILVPVRPEQVVPERVVPEQVVPDPAAGEQ